MMFNVHAACLCHKGKIRSNNEDNYVFDSHFLPEINQGSQKPLLLNQNTAGRVYLAVYDGMGGENFGETASFTAARLSAHRRNVVLDLLHSEEDYLRKLAFRLNAAVAEQGQKLGTSRMGTTMAAISLLGKSAYICNVGDSRVYQLREGQLLQLSIDHVSRHSQKSSRKAPLTQYLGVDPKEMQIEPSISRVRLKKKDRFLICSDGITDMLKEDEIYTIMREYCPAVVCVQALTDAALRNGGKDNITAIVCDIQ